MKSFNLNRNSWHYKLADLGHEHLHYYHEIDFCSYLRYMLIGAFKSLFVIALCLFFAFTCCVGTYGIVMAIIKWDYTQMNPLSLMYITFGVALFFVYYYSVIREKVSNRFSNRSDKKSNSFLSLSYKKFKEKTCFMVNFDD